MTALNTCSYRAYRPWFGTPVVTSLGLPKWLPQAGDWPRAWVLTPTWALLGATDEEFRAGYRERLGRFGAQKISRVLERIARDAGSGSLVILCHEVDWAQCHRSQWAAWALETTGELVTELLSKGSHHEEVNHA